MDTYSMLQIPFTWLSIDLLFERPEWMDEPRGPDVSRRMPYGPVVTFWQLVVDLVMGTNAPLGHGQNSARLKPRHGPSSSDQTNGQLRTRIGSSSQSTSHDTLRPVVVSDRPRAFAGLDILGCV